MSAALNATGGQGMPPYCAQRPSGGVPLAEAQENRGARHASSRASARARLGSPAPSLPGTSTGAATAPRIVRDVDLTPGGRLRLALDAFAGDAGRDVSLWTLHPAEGMHERAARRAAAGFARRLLTLDPGAGVWLALSREDGSALHFHGVGRTVLSESVLGRLWRDATRGAATARSSVDVRPPDDRRGGIRGWLGYSTRCLVGGAPTGVLCAGALRTAWRLAISAAGHDPRDRHCAWCFWPLERGQRPRACFCGVSCKRMARRARTRTEDLACPPIVVCASCCGAPSSGALCDCPGDEA